MSFRGVSGLALIVRRSLWQHRLSTLVTALAMALGAGLVMAVFAITTQARQAFSSGGFGYHAVLGARGSELQLVLNTVFHLETSPGNIPWKLYEEIAADPAVELAIPYAVGDNFKGFRIVGTIEKAFAARGDDEPAMRFAAGRVFDPAYREAVIGSVAAARTGLTIGSTFNPFHGFRFDPALKHAEEFTVVGILEPSNSPADRAIWIPLEGVYRMSGHKLDEGRYTPDASADIPDQYKEVSAVMLRFRSLMAAQQLYTSINRRGKVATLAFPIAKVMAEFFSKFDWIIAILSLVSWLVVLVATFSVLASLYNTMNERRREMAIMRALGARRRTLFAAIVLESTMIAGIGAAIGLVLYFVVLAAAAKVIREQVGVSLSLFDWHPALVFTPLGSLALGAIAGVLPAVKAYRTDVAGNLNPLS